MTKKNNFERLNSDSGNQEWRTPRSIISAARLVMGGIDLDPATTELANREIRATNFFTKEDNGLDHPWYGRVWMNHPYGRESNPIWINKLIEELDSDRTTQAMCIVFSSTSEKWFKPLLDFPMCFLYGRVKFRDLNGIPQGGAGKPSVVVGLNVDLKLFVKFFSGHLGRIMVPIIR